MGIRNSRFLAATTVAVSVLFILGVFAAGDPLAGKDSLTLRVNDAEAEPGGLAAIVIRTYSSRPLGQGQVCFRAASTALGSGGTAAGGDLGPFVRLEGVKVFGKGSVVSDATLETVNGGQNVVIHFSSDKARINQSDGPLAVVYLRLREDVRRRQTFRVGVDATETLLFGAAGEPITVETKAGTLEIRRRSSDPRVEPDGDTIRPGDKVRLGVESFEPFAIAAGQVGFRYDPAIAARTPTVKMDRRHGRRKMRVDASTPGLVLVEFQAKRGAINVVPGKFIEVRLRTSRAVPAGTQSELSFDPSLTFFEDPDGNILPIKTGSKMLTFEASGRGSGSSDDDSDTDADSDADSDDDSDDSDGDTDGDSDGDTDGDSDGDTDGDSDEDPDSDDDSEGDSEADSDDSDDSDDDSGSGSGSGGS